MSITWTSELTGEKFIALYDLSIDIRDAFQLSDEINIPVFSSLVRFPEFLPVNSIHSRDQYCELRLNAAKLLIKHELINNFDLIAGRHRWEGQIRIIVRDKNEFHKFVDILDMEYLEIIKIKETCGLKNEEKISMEKLRRILDRFHLFVNQLQHRQDNRPSLVIKDAYDVQDLMHSLLILYFDDIRPEIFTPLSAGKSARMDFILKPESIVLEMKMTGKGFSDKEIREQLIVDISHYSQNPDCNKLVCFIYDPENRIENLDDFRNFLSENKEKPEVEVVISPKKF